MGVPQPTSGEALTPSFWEPGGEPRSQAEGLGKVGSEAGCGGRPSPEGLEGDPSKARKDGAGTSGTLVLSLKGRWRHYDMEVRSKPLTLGLRP